MPKRRSSSPRISVHELAMFRKTYQSLLVLIATATHRELARQVRYLKVENEILRSKLPARVSVTDKEKSRLCRFAEKLGRALDELITMVHPDTIRRWLRERKGGHSAKATSAGRPRSFADLRKLIVKIACENPGWGYTRIIGELKKLKLTPPSRGTIRNILRERGIEPAPKRDGSTWDEFLRLHTTTLWQADVLSVRSLTTRGIRDLFLIVFLHVETRRVFITPSTTNPNEAWMVEQARAFIRQLPDEHTSKFYVQHDCDSKFSAAFDRAIKSANGKILRTPFRAPNLQAFVERFHQTLRREVLDHFLIFGQKHLDFLTRTFAPFYHSRRPLQGKENCVLSFPTAPASGKRKSPRQTTAPTITISLADVKCDRQLGGLLKHYHCKAA